MKPWIICGNCENTYADHINGYCAYSPLKFKPVLTGVTNHIAGRYVTLSYKEDRSAALVFLVRRGIWKRKDPDLTVKSRRDRKMTKLKQRVNERLLEKVASLEEEGQAILNWPRRV